MGDLETAGSFVKCVFFEEEEERGGGSVLIGCV